MGLKVCFIGHRHITDTPKLRMTLQDTLNTLTECGADTFLFGDHSAFNSLCYTSVTEMKERLPRIQRIKFRTDYEEVNEITRQILLTGYEDSICPKGISAAGKASYIKRNQAMIDASDICVFYYDESYQPERRRESKHSISTYQPRSGTRIAYEYAIKHKKEIINLCNPE